MAELAQEAPKQDDDPLIAALRALLGERLSTAAIVREHHGHDTVRNARTELQEGSLRASSTGPA